MANSTLSGSIEVGTPRCSWQTAHSQHHRRWKWYCPIAQWQNGHRLSERNLCLSKRSMVSAGQNRVRSSEVRHQPSPDTFRPDHNRLDQGIFAGRQCSLPPHPATGAGMPPRWSLLLLVQRLRRHLPSYRHHQNLLPHRQNHRPVVGCRSAGSRPLEARALPPSGAISQSAG